MFRNQALRSKHLVSARNESPAKKDTGNRHQLCYPGGNQSVFRGQWN